MRASRPWWMRSARRFIVGDQANGHTARLRCILLSWSVVRRPFGIVSQSSLGQRHSRACSLWIDMRQGSCSWLNIALVYRTLTCRHYTIIFVEVGVLVTFAICTFLVQWWLLSLLFRPCHGLRRPDHDDKTTWDAVIRVYRSRKSFVVKLVKYDVELGNRRMITDLLGPTCIANPCTITKTHWFLSEPKDLHSVYLAYGRWDSPCNSKVNYFWVNNWPWIHLSNPGMRVREARKLQASTRDTAPPASKINVIVNVDSSIMMAFLSLSSYRARLMYHHHTHVRFLIPALSGKESFSKRKHASEGEYQTRSE